LRGLSDKIIFAERTLEECKEPTWKIVDDLKRHDSRVDVCTHSVIQNLLAGKMREALGFEPTVLLRFASNYPLQKTETFDKVVEKYFEDDLAEECRTMTEVHRYLWQHHPEQPQYLVRTGFSHHANRRQAMPAIYTPAGPYITSYQWTGMKRVAYVLVPRSEGIEIHNKEDLELARLYMEKRLEEEK